MKIWNLGFVAGVLLLSACASDSVKNSDNPEVIYNAAVNFIEKERYFDATEHLNEIRHRFPQSRFAALAELKTGDMEFKQDNFTEAAAAYKVFVDLYPTHSQAAYALYQRALSYYNDSPEKIARDQTTASDAAAICDQLTARYANSEFAAKAAELRVKARRKLAEKEAYVARFYERRDAPESARKRWQGILTDYADLKNDSESAKLLAEAEEHALAAKP